MCALWCFIVLDSSSVISDLLLASSSVRSSGEEELWGRHTLHKDTASIYISVHDLKPRRQD